MMKRGSSDLKLLVVLTVFSAVSGLLLALVNNVTKDRIALVKVVKQQNALLEVLEPFDTCETETLLSDPFDPIETFTCKKSGAVTGIAVKISSRLLSADELKKINLADGAKQPQAYGDPIKMLVGFTADGKIKGISFLEHKETPGLGSNIEKTEFKANFAGSPVEGKNWAVKKDGGAVQQLTAATITSRAVTASVAKAIEIYKSKAKTLNLIK